MTRRCSAWRSPDASIFGLALSAAGLGLLATRANLASAALALATLFIYLTVYTPMKRRTPLATLVGAVPGALPPLIGWTASHGAISIGGLTLFAIVFLWQIPHFMAIAWLYRDDYRKAGFPMLPVVDPEGRRAGRQAVIYALALVPVSVIPTLVGISGRVYVGIALALGVALLWLAVRFAALRSDAAARRLFFGSIIYLPLLWAAMIGNTIAMPIHDLPAVNASLNALSTIFLVVGFALIRTRRMAQHRAVMLAALLMRNSTFLATTGGRVLTVAALGLLFALVEEPTMLNIAYVVLCLAALAVTNSLGWEPKKGLTERSQFRGERVRVREHLPDRPLRDRPPAHRGGQQRRRPGV